MNYKFEQLKNAGKEKEKYVVEGLRVVGDVGCTMVG
jgi:hypothetical protein